MRFAVANAASLRLGWRWRKGVTDYVPLIEPWELGVRFKGHCRATHTRLGGLLSDGHRRNIRRGPRHVEREMRKGQTMSFSQGCGRQ